LSRHDFRQHAPPSQTSQENNIMPTPTAGRYTVADPTICHGEPTFRGTRIMVADVLEPVESGMAWEAIAKAVRMAREALDGVATPIAYLKFKFFSCGGFN